MNRDRYRRFLLVGLVSLLSLATALPVVAATPEFTTVAVNETFDLVTCDGFTVIEHIEGTIKISTHVDQDGNLVMELNRVSLRHDYTNSVTGAMLSSPDVGIDAVRIRQGSETLAVVGLIRRIVVPGQGITLAAMGHLVVDLTTGEVIMVAGPHADLAAFFSALCSGLA